MNDTDIVWPEDLWSEDAWLARGEPSGDVVTEALRRALDWWLW